jgi:hypothetical protein
MRSNFDSPMKIEDGVAEACGELEWDQGETEAIVTVTITQREDQVEGTASSPPNFHPPEDEWMLQVRPSDPHKKFKKGPAHARGSIRTTSGSTGGGADDTFRWEQDIDLDPKAPDET